MNAPTRPKVAWLGDSGPLRLRRQLGKLGLSMRISAIESIEPKDAELRVVVLPLDSDRQAFRRQLSHVLPVLAGGAMVAVAYPGAAHRADAGALVGDACSRDKRVAVADLNDPAALAVTCLLHDPGRAVNARLPIDDSERCVQDSEHELLLRRAFGDLSSISVAPLPGGRSNAGVWKVLGVDKTGCCRQPFVVKAGSRRLIRDEIERTRANVAERIPFPHWTPLAEERCVEGHDQALMVSLFIERATRFDDYLAVDSATLAVSAIVDGPLRGWRRHRKTGEMVRLGVEYTRSDILPRADEAAVLSEPFRRAAAANPALKPPEALLAAICATPAINVAVCMSHGDLHTRNIFVRRNSLDVVLIDFARADRPVPCARDLACLDVSIGFDVASRGGSLLAEKELRGAYRSRLLSTSPNWHSDSRLEAVARVRAHALAEGIGDAEYDLTVACHLLRFARFPRDHPPAEEHEQRRALAYELAAALMETLSI